MSIRLHAKNYGENQGQFLEARNVTAKPFSILTSREDALQRLVTDMVKSIEGQEIALCASIDIVEAFLNTLYESIEKATLC